MIWHLFEIWISLFGAFGLGCLLGVSLYEWLDRSRFANTQGGLADAVGDVVDRIKVRLGVGAAWRPTARPAMARPVGSARPPPPRYRDDAVDGETAAEGEATTAAWEWQQRGRYRDPDMENWDAADTALLDDAEWQPELDLSGTYELREEKFVAADETVAPEKDATSMRPVGLASPRNGVPDDLQRIRGIGKRNEELLNGLGIFHFGQIAAWTPAEARWVGAFLAFPERIERDDWVGQATILASGGNTGYVKAADRKRARDEEASS